MNHLKFFPSSIRNSGERIPTACNELSASLYENGSCQGSPPLKTETKQTEQNSLLIRSASLSEAGTEIAHEVYSSNDSSQGQICKKGTNLVGYLEQMYHRMQTQVQVHEVNNPLYKTELCRSFEETGQCRYVDKCQFAHGLQELRLIPRHPKYKTEICKTFHTNGTCPYGIRCKFIHTLLESEWDENEDKNLLQNGDNILMLRMSSSSKEENMSDIECREIRPSINLYEHIDIFSNGNTQSKPVKEYNQALDENFKESNISNDKMKSSTLKSDEFSSCLSGRRRALSTPDVKSKLYYRTNIPHQFVNIPIIEHIESLNSNFQNRARRLSRLPIFQHLGGF
jgi:hypothetical protein